MPFDETAPGKPSTTTLKHDGGSRSVATTHVASVSRGGRVPLAGAADESQDGVQQQTVGQRFRQNNVETDFLSPGRQIRRQMAAHENSGAGPAAGAHFAQKRDAIHLGKDEIGN